MKRIPGAPIGMLAALICAAAQSAPYQFIDIRPAGATSVQVWDVSNLGQVVGSYQTGSLVNASFVWQAGAFTPVAGPAGAISVTAFSVSETGTIVGSFYDSLVIDPGTGESVPGPTRGFVLEAGTHTVLEIPGADFVQPRGISPDGRYVAGYYTHPAEGQVGFVLDRVNGALASTNAPGSLFNIAQGVDAAGRVAGGDTLPGIGSPGYVYDTAAGTRRDLFLPGASSTRLRDIDSTGRFAGWAVFPGAPGAPSVTRGVFGTELGFETLMFPGSSYTVLQGINDAGWLSGSYRIGATDPGFLGFVAIPVPEPASWLLWAAGAGLLAARRRRLASPR